MRAPCTLLAAVREPYAKRIALQRHVTADEVEMRDVCQCRGLDNHVILYQQQGTKLHLKWIERFSQWKQ